MDAGRGRQVEEEEKCAQKVNLILIMIAEPLLVDISFLLNYASLQHNLSIFHTNICLFIIRYYFFDDFITFFSHMDAISWGWRV